MNFYLADGKIYSMEYDEELGVYREFRLVHDHDDVYHLEGLLTGTPDKPENRQICSKAELIAQLGSAAVITMPTGDEMYMSEGKVEL